MASFLVLFPKSVFSLVLPEIRQKRKGAVQMRMTVLKMRITCKQKCIRIVDRGKHVLFPKLN